MSERHVSITGPWGPATLRHDLQGGEPLVFLEFADNPAPVGLAPDEASQLAQALSVEAAEARAELADEVLDGTHCEDCGRPIERDSIDGKPAGARGYCLGVATCIQAPEVEVQPIAAREVLDEAEARTRVEQFIEAEAALFIRYRDESGEVSYRHISPYEIRPVQRFPTWHGAEYVIAYCQLREQVRNFRIDRIEAIAPSVYDYVPEGGE